MNWTRYVEERVPPMALPAARAAEIRAELAQLLEDEYEDARRSGSPHDEAFTHAAAQLPEGEALARWIEEAERPVAAQIPASLHPEKIEDRLVKSPRGLLMNNLLQDVKYAVRMLAKNPAFTAVAILTLALGIGANTAIFTVVNEAMVRPRPGIGAPEGIVDIGRSDRGQGFDNMSYPNFRDYRERNTTLAAMAALEIEPRAVSLGGGAEGAERVYATPVSGNYFDVLQVKAHAGRFFLPEEDRVQGAVPVVVLSHGFWQRRFRSDAGIVGSTIKLNGLGYTVVGVAAPEFRGTIPVVPDLWIPMMMVEDMRNSPGLLDCRQCSFMIAVGRLKPGVTVGQAQAEFNSISAALEKEYPRENEGRGANLYPSRLFPGTLQYMVGAFLGLLMVIVGLVIVIASVNVAGMMLVRAMARRKEIAVRLAIGAGRGHIIKQMVAEGVLLFLAGGVVGLVFASWMRNGLVRLLPALPFPVTFDLQLDWRVVLFALGMSLVAGLIASLVPALQASRPDLLTALKDDGQGGGFRRMRLRSALVLGQVALSLVLLICAGLFMRALNTAASINPGFNMAGLHAVGMDFSLAGMQQDDGTEFAYRFLERVRAVPGVKSASWAWSVPLDGGGRGLGAFYVPGTSSPDGTPSWNFDWSVITPGYFETMGIPLVRGRDFNEGDNSTAQRVAIINERAARLIWPEQDPLGKTFQMGDPRRPETLRNVVIVGVARDQKYRSLDDEPRNFAFVPLRQRFVPPMSLMVRTENAAAVFPSIRAVLRELNPNLPILNILSMDQYAALSMFPQRVASWVSGTLGLVGLTLVGMGIYGVMAFSIEQRTREIGVRMALGADRGNVLRMVLAQGLRLAGWGIAIGLGLSAAASQLLSSLLYGVSALDPVTFGGVAAVVLTVGTLATLVPARRATQVDPLVALRYE